MPSLGVVSPTHRGQEGTVLENAVSTLVRSIGMMRVIAPVAKFTVPVTGPVIW